MPATKNVTTIAIVEDEPVFLGQFERVIAREAGMRVVARAGDLAGGMALLTGPAPDVLLVDLGLPDGDGTALIGEATVRWPQCEVMVVTVFGSPERVMAALRAGATGYLLKDSPPSQLTAQIRALREGGSPISPAIARLLLAQLPPEDAPAVPPSPPQPVAEGNQPLSDKEREVLSRAARGYSYKEIAVHLGVSPHTVATHVKRCFRKLQVNSKSEAVYEARRHGYIAD